MWLVVKWRRRLERTKGGGGATTGTTQQPAGEQDVNEKGGVSRQEAMEG